MPGFIKSEVTIIGAGPAGITAALVLAKKGIPCLLIDKYQFPRGKICGDGLGGKVVSVLNRIDPAYVPDFSRQRLRNRFTCRSFFFSGSENDGIVI